MCNQVTAKRNFSKRHAHDTDNDNQTPMPGFPLTRPDSPNSNTKKRKVSVDVEVGSLVDMFLGPIRGEESTSESETATSRTSVVPSTVYTARDQDSVFMMVSRSEAALLDLVRSRGSILKVIQDILQSSNGQSQRRIMEEDILTDDESEREATPSRMPSLGIIDVFTESFENLMK